MTEERAVLVVQEARQLDEPCVGCGHERRRHLYSDGACLHASDRRHCHCSAFENGKAAFDPAILEDDAVVRDELKDEMKEASGGV